MLRLVGVDAPLRPGGDEELYYPYTAGIAGRLSAGAQQPAGHFAHPPLGQLVMGAGAAIAGIELRSATSAEAANTPLPARFAYADGTTLLAVVRREEADPLMAAIEIEPRLPPYERPAGDSAWKSLGDYALERVRSGERFLYLIPDLPRYRNRYLDLWLWRVEPVHIVAEGREIRLHLPDESVATTITLESAIEGAIAISRPAIPGSGTITLWVTTVDGSLTAISMDPEIGAEAPRVTAIAANAMGGRLTQLASGYGETLARRANGEIVSLNAWGQVTAAREAPAGKIEDARLDAEGRAYWMLRTDDGRNYALRPSTIAGARIGSALLATVTIVLTAVAVAIAGGGAMLIVVSALFAAIDPAGILAGRTLLVDGPTGMTIAALVAAALYWWRGRQERLRAALLIGASIGLVLSSKFVLWAIAPIAVLIGALVLPRGPQVMAVAVAAVVVGAAANVTLTTPAGPWAGPLIAGAGLVAAHRLRRWTFPRIPLRVGAAIVVGALATTVTIYGTFIALSGTPLPEAIAAYRDGVLYQVTVRGDYESQWWGWPLGFGLMELRVATRGAEIFSLTPAVGLLAITGAVAFRRLGTPMIVAAVTLCTWAGWGLLTRFALTSNAAHLTAPFAIAAAFAAARVVADRRAGLAGLLFALLAGLPATELGGVPAALLAPLFVLAVAAGGAAARSRAPIPVPVATALLASAILLPRMASLMAPVGPIALIAPIVAGLSGGALVGRGQGWWAIGAAVAASSVGSLPMAIGLGGELPNQLLRIDVSPSLVDALAVGPALYENLIAPPIAVLVAGLFGAATVLFATPLHAAWRRLGMSGPLSRRLRSVPAHRAPTRRAAVRRRGGRRA
jgi:hypothetical protein